MLEKRNLKADLFALGLAGLLVFLALALVTHNPGDPVAEFAAPLGSIYTADVAVYPQEATITNACGRWGALASDMLLSLLGCGAYYLVFSLAILDVSLLRRQTIDTPLLRLFGWMVTLVCICVLSAMLFPGLLAAPMVGSGGYLGALGAGVLHLHFATVGGTILVASLLLAGMLLCTDYAVMQWGGRVAAATSAAALSGKQKLAKRTPKRRTTDLEMPAITESEDEEEENVTPIRVRNRKNKVSLEEEEAESAEEVVEEQEEEEASAEPVVKKKEKFSRKDRKKEKEQQNEEAREQMIAQLEKASLEQRQGEYELPDLDLLIEGDDVNFEDQAVEVRRKAKILEQTFAQFGFQVKVVEIETGPVIAQYEIELEAGLRLSKITGLADDIAIALRVPSVRIVAPIPGKNTVGIEVPNENRQVVRLRDVMEEENGRSNKMRIPLYLGKDVSGNPLLVDLSTLPHLLIAGRTGTGKSVCLNAIISSILMTRTPQEVRMLMIDPKMVELSGYGRLPHLMHPVVTDMKKAEAILAWAVEKMEERYALLAKVGVRHISSYNQLGEEELFDRLQVEDEEQRKSIPTHLPFIVIVADEMADLMMTAGKEVEQHIVRLAQKSRAVGIHLILATQRPTVDVITGLIKSNLPARICFQVASRTDSRVVLDEMGADKLLGNGDMLFLWPGTSQLLRGQGTYLSDEEINAVTDCVSQGEQHFVHELVNMTVEEEGEEAEIGGLKKRDELYEGAVDIVVREGRGSVSLLQRTLGIGYGRAARLIDYMAEDKIVGEYNGSQAREVNISLEQWERMQGIEPESGENPRRTNKVLPETLQEADHYAAELEDDYEEADYEEDDNEETDEEELWEEEEEYEEEDEYDDEEYDPYEAESA